MWSPPSDLASISSHVADVAPALAPLNFGAMEHLAAYDSSDDDADEPADPPAKRNCPAPLPPPPLDGDTDDAADAALVRQFPHVDGNFAAHVFLTVVPAPALQQAIDRAVAALGVHRLAEYHVSLSRTFVLRRPQIAPFGEALRKALRGCAAVRTECDALHQLPNDTSTRHFAAVGLRRGTAGHGAACRLVDAVDAVLARYDAPPFYAERRLHFSVAWSLDALPAERFAAAADTAALGGFEVRCAAVSCKIGDKTTEYALKGEPG